MGPIQVISLDATGTCLDLTRPLDVVYREVAARFGIELDPQTVADRFARVLRRMPPLAFPGVPLAERESLARAWWRRLVAQVVAARQWPPATFDVFFQELYAVFARPDVWRVYPEVRPFVDRLRQRGYTVICISNADARLRGVLRGLGLDASFDRVFLSAELDWAKPDPALFRYAARSVGVEPSRMLHIGDDPVADCAGALRAGCAAVLVRRAAGPTSAVPAPVVHDLLEVLPLLADGPFAGPQRG